jgi:hypothetical protein
MFYGELDRDFDAAGGMVEGISVESEEKMVVRVLIEFDLRAFAC